MTTIRIVGGGLTGILAAFEAHRLGCRDIVLHERFDHLGGVALPRQAHGLELRDSCLYFGPSGDPIRTCLEGHGLEFADFENRFGSVSPGSDGLLIGQDFGGPVLDHDDIDLCGDYGETLGSRMSAYPIPIHADLAAYVRWHLDGADPATIHESAAIPLAINRVFPCRADLEGLAELKREGGLYDELYAIPRSLWGRTDNAMASLPKHGFQAFFRACRQRLTELGVTIQDLSLVSPRHALMECDAGEILVWAASPTTLFKAAGMATPPLLKKSFSVYAYRCGWDGPLPFYVQNFTAQGAVFRAYLYQTAGQAMVVAECVREAEDPELRADLARLTEPFGRLWTGQLAAMTTQPRWIYHSAASIAGLAALRRGLAARTAGRFIAGAWEPYAKSAKFAEVNAALAAALAPAAAKVAAA